MISYFTLWETLLYLLYHALHYGTLYCSVQLCQKFSTGLCKR